jgi:hypothetical protein
MLPGASGGAAMDPPLAAAFLAALALATGFPSAAFGFVAGGFAIFFVLIIAMRQG